MPFTSQILKGNSYKEEQDNIVDTLITMCYVQIDILMFTSKVWQFMNIVYILGVLDLSKLFMNIVYISWVVNLWMLMSTNL